MNLTCCIGWCIIWECGWWAAITGKKGAPYGVVGAPIGPACEAVASGRLKGGGVPPWNPCLSNPWTEI